VGPVRTATFLILEASQPGATGPEKNLLATLRFHDVDEVQLQDFNHNNSIVRFTVSELDRGQFMSGEALPPAMLVKIEHGFGLKAPFHCSRIEAVLAEWASPEPLGKPLP